MNIVGVISLVSDLHPGPEGAHRRKVFDSEADRLRSRGEAAIAEPLPRAATALAEEQFGRRGIIKRGHMTPFRRPPGSQRLEAGTPSLMRKVPRQSDGSEQASCRVKNNFEGMKRSAVRHN